MASKTVASETIYSKVLPDIIKEIEEGYEFTVAEVCPAEYSTTKVGMYLSRLATICGDDMTHYINNQCRNTYTLHDKDTVLEGLDKLRGIEEDGRVDREIAQQQVKHEFEDQDASLEDVMDRLAEEGIGKDIPRRIEIAQDILE